MNKTEYANMLMERIKYMNDINFNAHKRYKELLKIKGNTPLYDDDYYLFIRTLDENDYKIFVNEGIVYKELSFKRLRIELNTIMLEIEKDGQRYE